MPPGEPEGGSWLLRADDCAATPSDFDKRKAVAAVLDSIAVYGPMN